MPHSIHTRRLTSPRARLLTAAGLLTGALAVTGCGGSSGPGVAHLFSGKTSSAASPGGSSFAPESTANPQQALIAFAKCMRSNGLPNFPDPTTGGFRLAAGMNPSSLAFKTAQAKCRKFMPSGGPPGPGSTTNPSPQTLTKMLNMARCMRQHGVYDFPDPRTSVPSNPFGSRNGTGVISDIEGVILIFSSKIDERSPEFTRAAAGCAVPLHNH
jgi:hypothetical protein